MSFVRNPINRIVSLYYYIRGRSGGWRATQKENALKRKKQVAKGTQNYTLQECVLDMYDGKNSVCALSVNLLIRWFCGSHAVVCDPHNITRLSLRRAQHNMDHMLHFVGILEHYEHSMCLFRRKFPDFFDMSQTWTHFVQRMRDENKRQKRDRKKQGYGHYADPKPSVRTLLATANALDLELYDWVVQRFRNHVVSNLPLACL